MFIIISLLLNDSISSIGNFVASQATQCLGESMVTLPCLESLVPAP